MRRWAWLLLCCSSLAVAQTPRALFEEGTALFEKGEFERAAERFEASFALRPVPVTRFNAARSWEKAGKTLKAIDAWQAWLEMSPGAPQRPEGEAALQALGQRLAGQGVQALTVTSLPLGARVTIDGTPRGVTPLTVELPATPHLVRLDLEGREPTERRVDFSLAAPRVERFELAPLGQAPGPVALPGPTPLLPAPLPRPEVPRPTDPEFALSLSDDVAQVHIEADNREVRLFRANGNPNGECRAPCDAPVARATELFFIGGQGVTTSGPFVLADHRKRGRVSMTVKAGNAGLFVGLGTLLITGGVAGLSIGLGFGISGGSSGRDVAVPVGLGLGLGLTSILAAAVVMATNGTSVTFDEE